MRIWTYTLFIARRQIPVKLFLEIVFMSPSANDNTPRLMAPKEAALATSLSRTLLALMADAGEFPAPVRLGERRVAYVRTEVNSWIDVRIGSRQARAA